MKKALLLLSLLGILAFSGCVSETPAGQASLGEGPASDQVLIPLEKVGTQAKFYEFESGGKTVRFFAVKASDGSIKTAFDACDVCFNSKKGYRQEGKDMLCNNCGNRYPIDGLGTENKRPGGCWPGYLPSRIEGSNLVIEKSDLAAGVSRFS
jgi:uncharacterized membrane protein